MNEEQKKNNELEKETLFLYEWRPKTGHELRHDC